MKVVLVDDEQWIVTGLARILSKQYPGIEIQAYTNPQDALEAISISMPDLLITDIRMPQMNGLKLIEQVRELGLRFYAVLTGLDDIELVKQSVWLKVSEYLTKPVNKAELFRLVDHVRDRLAEMQHRAAEELPGVLRLCAVYGSEDAALNALAGEYRTALVVRYREKQAALPPEIAELFSLSIELWNLDQSCWLYLAKQAAPSSLETMLERVETILSFEAAPFDPAYLHQQFAHTMSEGDGQPCNAVALFCSTPPRHLEAAQCLLKHMTPEGNPPMALDTFCTAVSLRLPFRRVVEIADACVRNQTDAQALADLLCSLPPLVTPHSADVRLTIHWVQSHYRESITLAQAATNVYLQANYFTTLFRKEMDVSFIQYLNELRVDMACRFILENPNASFEEVAQRNGFVSLRHFYTMFKKYAKQTPGKYRHFVLETGFAR